MDQDDFAQIGLQLDDNHVSVDNNNAKENGRPIDPTDNKQIYTDHTADTDACQDTLNDELNEKFSSNEYNTKVLQETGWTEEETKPPINNQIGSDEHNIESGSEDGEDPETVEEQFMSAIESSNIPVIMDMLTLKEEHHLNINYRNSNGETPLSLAITEGSSVIVDHLLLHGVHVGDALLRAVDVGFEETIQKICGHASKLPTADACQAILDCHCEDDDYHPDVTPIVLAAQRNDFIIVKLLSDYGCKIDSSKKQKASSKATDDLQKSVGSLEIYRALSSEAYLSQVNEDPVEAAFKLSKKLRILSHTDVEFKPTYLQLAESTDVTGTEIISFARDTEEMLTVLNHREVNRQNGNLGPLPKLSRAIYFNQKRFVAHQNCQQAVLSQFYGRMAFLRDKGTSNKLLFFLCMFLCFPMMSLLYLYVPIKWVKTYIGSPYMKFVLKFASDFTFVALMTADTILQDGFQNDLSLNRPTKIILFVWIVGIAWREIKSIQRQKLDALSQFSHWRDILLVALFLTGVILDIVSYKNKEDVDKVISLSRRDTYSISLESDFISRYTLVSDTKFEEYPVILHRVARQIRKPGKGPGALAGEEKESKAVNRSLFHEAYLSYNWWHPSLLSNAMFALSTVISLLRMLPYVVVSNVIGPLQISLGSMVTRTAHFFLVVAVVLFSFAVGLTYIYSYYEEANSITCDDTNEKCRDGYFTNLFFASLYLYWSALGLESQRPLKLDNQAQVLEAAGLILYGMFYVLLIIVLLNALIAVMSEVYNEVEENADVEWKFHSTVMWMSILLDDDVAPPPFNLLPSYESIKNTITTYLNLRWKRRNSSYLVDTGFVSKASKKEKTESKRINSKDRYKHVMSQLVERYVMAKTADEISVEADISINDVRALRNDIIALKAELFQKLLGTKNYIDNTTVDGSLIRDTSVTAKHVLEKAEEIHENVNDELLGAVVNFKSSVEERRSEIPQQSDLIVADFGTQTDPPPNRTQGVQYEAFQSDICTQTTMVCEEIAIQTEEMDFEPEGDTAGGGIVAKLVGAYEQLQP